MANQNTPAETAPVIRISFDLVPGGIRDIVVHHESDEELDEVLERLNTCLPLIELLQQRLQNPEVLQGSAS
jgi:hypothetical protein